MNYHTICPECKNDIALQRDELKTQDVVECEMCGITLEVTTVNDGAFETEIVEEEK